MIWIVVEADVVEFPGSIQYNVQLSIQSNANLVIDNVQGHRVTIIKVGRLGNNGEQSARKLFTQNL